MDQAQGYIIYLLCIAIFSRVNHGNGIKNARESSLVFSIF